MPNSVSIIGNYPNNGKSIAMFSIVKETGDEFLYPLVAQWCYDGHKAWQSKIVPVTGDIEYFNTFAEGNAIFNK